MTARQRHPGLLVAMIAVPLIVLGALLAWSPWGRVALPPDVAEVGGAGFEAKRPPELPSAAAEPVADGEEAPLAGEPKGDEVAAVPSTEDDEPTPTAWRLRGCCTTPTYDDGKPPKPIAGARITISCAGPGGRDWLTFPAVTTGDDGRFSVDLEPLKQHMPAAFRRSARWRVDVVKAGWAFFAGRDPRPLQPPFRDDVGYQPALHVQMERGAVITVAVRDAAGQLVPDAELHIPEADDLDTATGYFTVHRHEKGAVRFVARSNRGFSRPVRVDVNDFKHYAVPDLVLRPLRTIEGVVRHADGAPASFVTIYGDECADEEAEDVEVDLEAEQPLPTAREDFEVTTDRNGRFRVSGLSDRPYEIAPVGSDNEIKAWPGRGLVILTLRQPRLVVRTFFAGEPRAGVLVNVVGWPEAIAERVEAKLSSPGRNEAEALEKQAMFQGQYAAEPPHASFAVRAPAGSLWLVQVHAAGLVPERRVVRIPPRQNHVSVPLHLRPLAASGSLVLDVRKDSGSALEEVLVRLRPTRGLALLNGLASSRLGTGERIDGIPPGRYEVAVSVPQNWGRPEGLSFFERVDRVVDIGPGENEFTARLAGRGVIDVSLTFPKKGEAERINKAMTVDLRTAAGAVIEPPTGARDVYGPRIFVRTVGLPSGRYVIRLVHGSAAILERTVDVRAGRNTIIKAQAETR